ncbi:MAG: LptE family protein, partial [Mucinivorans sp.]
MIKRTFILVCLGILCWGCKVSYTFSGASIAPAVKTASVAYFNNMAAMVAPILSPTLTDQLTQKIQNQTRLQIVREEGDVSFEGEIINYISAPIAISGNETATKNRLTISVKVRFTNKVDPKLSYDKTFSSYAD